MNNLEDGAASEIEATVSNFKSFSEVLEEVITNRQAEIDSMILQLITQCKI